ncbi:MAG: hypothetical protein AAFR61_00280 [Bacteroidota bacterium]
MKTHIFRFLFLLVAYLLTLPNMSLQAQNNGYMGKHWLIKSSLTDPLLVDGFRAEVEAVVFRRVGLSFDFQQRSTRDMVQENDFAFNDSLGIFQQSLGISYRHYFNRAMLAPMGSYYLAGLRIGRSDLDYSSFRTEDGGGYQLEVYRRRLKIRSAMTSQLVLGIGRQHIFGGRWVVDANAAVYFSIHEKAARLALPTELHHRAGGDFLPSFQRLFFQETVSSGLNLNLSIGMLLF